jgi:pyruvate,water dikinase
MKLGLHAFQEKRGSTIMTAVTNIRWFRDIGLDDVASVGGKNASLGELYSVLSGQDVRVPNGFALG